MNGKRILNVGCGDQTYGTDFVDLYPSRPEVQKCNIDEEDFPYPDETFDEVYSKNLFEHLKNPNLVLKKMFRVLKTGGKLVVITDNASCVFWHVKQGTHYGGYEKLHEAEDRHYAFYTSHHMKNHLESAGFREIKVNYMNLKLKFSHNLVSSIFSLFSKRIGKVAVIAEAIK